MYPSVIQRRHCTKHHVTQLCVIHTTYIDLQSTDNKINNQRYQEVPQFKKIRLHQCQGSVLYHKLSLVYRLTHW